MIVHHLCEHPVLYYGFDVSLKVQYSWESRLVNLKNVKATFIWSPTTIKLNDTLSYLIPSILDDTLSVSIQCPQQCMYRKLVLWARFACHCGVVEVP